MISISLKSLSINFDWKWDIWQENCPYNNKFIIKLFIKMGSIVLDCFYQTPDLNFIEISLNSNNSIKY